MDIFLLLNCPSAQIKALLHLLSFTDKVTSAEFSLFAVFITLVPIGIYVSCRRLMHDSMQNSLAYSILILFLEWIGNEVGWAFDSVSMFAILPVLFNMLIVISAIVLLLSVNFKALFKEREKELAITKKIFACLNSSI